MQFQSTGTDSLFGVAVLPGGDFVVAGNYQRSLAMGLGLPSEQTVEELCVAGSWEGFVSRFRPDRTWVWTRRVGGCLGASVVAIAVDPLNSDILVTGTYLANAQAETGGATLLDLWWDSPPSRLDTYVARYDEDGLLLWINQQTATGYAGPEDLDVAPDGTVYFGGSHEGVLTIKPGEPDAITLPDTGGNPDNLVVAYSADGAALWASASGAPETSEFVRSVAGMAQGVVYTPGNSGDLTLGVGEPSETTLTGSLGMGAPIASLGVDGTLLWARMDPSTPMVDLAGVAGDSYLTCGSTPGIEALFGGDPPVATVPTAAGYVAHYELDGAFNWVAAPQSGVSGCVCVDQSVNTVASGGYLGDEVRFDGCAPNLTSPEGNGLDVLVTTWDLADGASICAWRFGGPGQEHSAAVAVTPEGGVYVVGDFDEPITLWEGTVRETVLTPQGSDGFVVYIPPAEP